MKKFLLLLTVFTTASILLSCNSIFGSDSDNQRSLTEIREILESEEAIEPQSPFVEREFDLNVNGEWIGQAVSYGCYRDGQSPGTHGPSESEILEDLNIISQYWKLIRVYGADDDTERIAKVIHENNIPVKVMLGIWLEKEENNSASKANNIAQALRSIEIIRKYPDAVNTISVGNETQVFWSWHRMSAENLTRYIRTVRNNVTVPVTTVDDIKFWDTPGSRIMAEEVDYIAVNLHPVWQGKQVETSIGWLDSTYTALQTLHVGKHIVVGETGWATNWNPSKIGPGEQGTLIKGDISLDAQERYLIDLNEWINENKVCTFLFEAFDEAWKGGGAASGPNEVEKHWGVFYSNRTPKASFTNYLEHIK